MRRAAILLAASFALPAVAEVAVPQTAAQVQLSYAPLVKAAAPAVVNIYAKQVVEARRSIFDDDPFFREFFRDFGSTQPRVQNSLGSGVILSEDGIVVSNYHVVGEASDIRVVLNDRREYRARVLLADAESDLALLQLEGARDMPRVTLRESDSVEVGELVLAIGNPFGVGQTVSSGIVSGLARSGSATGQRRGYFIQTDAPINPGNSGGALIDMSGRLIGINTSILTRSGGSNGIGFAIPAALVAQFMAQARAGETTFQRPWAGVGGQPVDADLAEGLGLGAPRGVLISQLHPQSALKDAGIAPGDVITHVDGAPVNTPAEMFYRFSIKGPGGTAGLTRWRGGKSVPVTVPLILPPEGDEAPVKLGRRSMLPGLEIARLSPRLGVELGRPMPGEEVVVTRPGEPGARVGLRRGDVLLGINGADITAPEDVARALRGAERRVEMLIERGDRRLVLRFRT